MTVTGRAFESHSALPVPGELLLPSRPDQTDSASSSASTSVEGAAERQALPPPTEASAPAAGFFRHQFVMRSTTGGPPPQGDRSTLGGGRRRRSVSIGRGFGLHRLQRRGSLALTTTTAAAAATVSSSDDGVTAAAAAEAEAANDESGSRMDAIQNSSDNNDEDDRSHDSMPQLLPNVLLSSRITVPTAILLGEAQPLFSWVGMASRDPLPPVMSHSGPARHPLHTPPYLPAIRPRHARHVMAILELPPGIVLYPGGSIPLRLRGAWGKYVGKLVRDARLHPTSASDPDTFGDDTHVVRFGVLNPRQVLTVGPSGYPAPPSRTASSGSGPRRESWTRRAMGPRRLSHLTQRLLTELQQWEADDDGDGDGDHDHDDPSEGAQNGVERAVVPDRQPEAMDDGAAAAAAAAAPPEALDDLRPSTRRRPRANSFEVRGLFRLDTSAGHALRHLRLRRRRTDHDPEPSTAAAASAANDNNADGGAGDEPVDAVRGSELVDVGFRPFDEDDDVPPLIRRVPIGHTGDTDSDTDSEFDSIPGLVPRQGQENALNESQIGGVDHDNDVLPRLGFLQQQDNDGEGESDHDSMPALLPRAALEDTLTRSHSGGDHIDGAASEGSDDSPLPPLLPRHLQPDTSSDDEDADARDDDADAVDVPDLEYDGQSEPTRPQWRPILWGGTDPYPLLSELMQLAREPLPHRAVSPARDSDPSGDPWIDRIGTMVTVAYTHEDALSGLDDVPVGSSRVWGEPGPEVVVTAVGTNRFRIVQAVDADERRGSRDEVRRYLVEEVTEDDAASPHLLVNPRGLGANARLQSLAAQTPVPAFVWRRVWPDHLASQIRAAMRRIPVHRALLASMDGKPRNPLDLGYWLATNLALREDEKIYLLQVSPVERLQWLLDKVLESDRVDSVIECKECEYPLARAAQSFTVGGCQGTTGNCKCIVFLMGCDKRMCVLFRNPHTCDLPGLWFFGRISDRRCQRARTRPPGPDRPRDRRRRRHLHWAR